MFRRVLVPLDGSALAEAVLPQATELARLHGAELVLLRVESAPDYAVVQAAEEAQHYMRDVAASLREAHVRVSAMVVLSGDTAGEILVQAELTAADLILMSTHGRSGVGRWMLGSVAEKVLRAAVTPVLLVRVPSPRRSPSRRG